MGLSYLWVLSGEISFSCSPEPSCSKDQGFNRIPFRSIPFRSVPFRSGRPVQSIPVPPFQLSAVCTALSSLTHS